MKPQAKFKVYKEKLKKCLVLYLGIFLCMYQSRISAGAKCGRPGRTSISGYEPSGNEFSENDKIRYTCNKQNHVILGNPERTCLKTGSWSDDIPVCSKVAYIERIQLMFQEFGSEDLSNYTTDGDVSTCAEASVYNWTVWRGQLAASVTVSAVQISFISTQEIDIDVQVIEEEHHSGGRRCRISDDGVLGDNIKSVKTLTFKCPTAVTGKFVQISCNEPLAFCEISVLQPPGDSCLSPDVPLHGNGRKVLNGSSMSYHIRCDDGYKAWGGAIVVTCQADGRWKPKSTQCEEIYCHPPEDIENGYVDYTTIKRIIPYNGTAKYSCKEGFYLSGRSVIRCHRWQTWDSPSPLCKPLIIENTDNIKSHPQTESWRQTNVTHCGNLPPIANGAIIVNSSHVGSTAWLKCSEGFRPLTDDHVICLPSGNWNTYSLHCAIIQCEENPVIPHGKAVLLDNSFVYGSHLQIKCNQGYASHTTVIRKCNEYGSWGDLNICVEINCGAFEAEEVSNGHWLKVNGSTSLYVLICPENFHIEGSPAVIRCLSNGSWSYSSARCQKSLTSFWGSNWTPSLMLITAVAAGVATAIVILCLSVAFLVIKKRRQAQTNTTVFHLENTSQKDRTRDINSQRQKHHSATENYNAVELRSKSICTFPRKPRSALPNLPVDADPVYAQPFETSAIMKTTSITAANKKDDIYNTHIYAEPVNSRRHTPTHILVNIDNLRKETDSRLSVARTNLENELPDSAQSGQNNCDKKCAIYDSSENSGINTMKIHKGEHVQNHNGNTELGTLKKNLEYLELELL